ncbi:MAG: non-canonical purine NTP pyrophosphatase, partial [Gammaproteobacteria bacterium]
VENALVKARHAAAGSGLPAIADDSGLVVDALDGDPGVFSARYAGPGASDADNNRKLLDALTDVPLPRRTARFVCLVVLLRHPRDPLPVICQGAWEGTVLEAPRGEAGFGYDPVFLPAGSRHSAAEMTPAQKNQSSHRARAFACLMERLGRR